MPILQKIDGFACLDFEDYFENNPEAVGEFVGFARILCSPSTLPALLESWARGLGADPSHPALARLLSPLGPQTKPGPEDRTRFSEAERQWLEFGIFAPVAMATMIFQEDREGNIELITTDPATNQIKWEATSSFLRIPYSERNSSCESDAYEGNRHQADQSAPKKARDWAGPFRMLVELYEPSPHLKSLRKEGWMSRVLPSASPSPRPSGIRF